MVCHHQKGGNCWPYPYGFDDANTNVIIAWVCWPNKSKCIDWNVYISLVTLFQEQVLKYSRLSWVQVEDQDVWSFLQGILYLDCFIFPRFLLICHMRITQSNKRLAWFLDFQNRSRNRVFRVFLNWNSEKSLTFSLFNLDRPLFNSEKSLLVGSPN